MGIFNLSNKLIKKLIKEQYLELLNLSFSCIKIDTNINKVMEKRMLKEKHRIYNPFSYHCRQKAMILCLLAWHRSSLFHSQMCHFQSAVTASWGQTDALLGVKNTSCWKGLLLLAARANESMFTTRVTCKVNISIFWNTRNNCTIKTWDTKCSLNKGSS